MHEPVQLDGVSGDSDITAAARLVTLAFAGTMEGSEKWLRDSGPEHVRVLRPAAGGAPVATLLRIPMGQFFGGRAVPMLGIAGVAVGPELRGQGLARELMTRAMQQAAADGFPLSGLYASTLGLYRQVGYEQAGHRFVTTLPVGRIDVHERAGPVRPVGPGDDAAIRACYTRFARAFNGTLDRTDYCWRRIREIRGVAYSGFVIDGDPADGGAIDGYLFLSQERNTRTGFQDLSLSDLAFTTPQAGRRLLGFLADFATMAETVSFGGGPMHPIVSLLSLRQSAAEKKDYWMLRVLDVKRAIEARGFSPAIRASVAIRIDDPIVPGNTGVWRIDVEGGAARAEPTADAGALLHCDIRGLAPLYSGLYTARQLAMLGWMSGTDAGFDAADAIFGGGGTPWMSDMF